TPAESALAWNLAWNHSFAPADTSQAVHRGRGRGGRRARRRRRDRRHARPPCAGPGHRATAARRPVGGDRPHAWRLPVLRHRPRGAAGYRGRARPAAEQPPAGQRQPRAAAGRRPGPRRAAHHHRQGCQLPTRHLRADRSRAALRRHPRGDQRRPGDLHLPPPAPADVPLRARGHLLSLPDALATFPSAPALAVALGALFVGALVQGALGFGLGLVSIPMLALLVPDRLPQTVVLAVLPLTIYM